MNYYEPKGAFQSDKAFDPDNQPCNCIGPQWVFGELQPGCPCAMRKAATSTSSDTMTLDEWLNKRNR